MQFIINAYDGKDKDALERRMSVRPSHLENMAKIKENGNVICAGGITDNEGKLIGSFLVMEFPSKAELEEYLERKSF